MPVVEIRDLDSARRFVIQGVVLQRVTAVNSTSIQAALQWALEISSSGHPLMPVGFVGDLGQILSSVESGVRSASASHASAGLPGGLVRAYEDFVLGGLYADASIERAGHIVRRLKGRDRNRAVAFVAEQFRERAEIGGVLFSPAVIKSLAEASPDDVLRGGWESLQRLGLMPLLATMYGELVVGSRRISGALASEDLFELEHETALADLSQRVALRQIIATAARFESSVHRLAAVQASPREVPTNIIDEDTYPVGGFASLSTRGSVESLLHSQLAYMEPAGSQRPDLFDVKYLRDELLYFSRDENQFFRQRRSFVFVLSADLGMARFKDPELPVQRIILTLAFLCAAVRRLSEWLSSDALHFSILTPAGDELAQESELLRMIFREAIGNGTVSVAAYRDDRDAAQQIEQLARGRRLSALTLSTQDSAPKAGQSHSSLIVASPRPALRMFGGATEFDEMDPAESWRTALEQVLQEWTMAPSPRA